MTKLNWRDASKELPKDMGLWIKPCLIVLKQTNGERYIYQSYYDQDHGWDEKDIPDDEVVTHWTYLDEIPLPKE